MADFVDEEEAITDEERLQIAQHFLLSSPPCQFHEVLADVKKILPDGLLTDPLTVGIARAHNVKSGKVVTSPDDSKVLLLHITISFVINGMLLFS